MPTKAEKQPPTFYSASEVAPMFGVTPRAIAKWCAGGRFKGAFRAGDGETSPWRIPTESADSYLAEIKKRAQAVVA